MEKYKDDLTVNPIEFTGTRHNGKPENNGDTATLTPDKLHGSLDVGISK